MRSFTANINGIEPSSLASVASLASSWLFKFKCPAANLKPMVQFDGKNNKANSELVAADSASCFPSSVTSRRRPLLLCLSTMSFLVPFQESLVGQGAPALANAANENAYIMEEILKVLSKGKAAGVLRLVFHDAGTFENNSKTGGMNGSIVYELDRPENKGLKQSVKILEKAKSQIDVISPVSWSDMIAVAGSVAVSLCGGPTIKVKLGRLDSSGPDPEGRLPEESLDAVNLKKCFQRKGFSTQDLVALSGAHTLGSKGFGDPTAFDNSYFKILLEKPWLSAAGMSTMVGLPSDRALVDDDECQRWISEYAGNQDLFFEDFKNAYTKLVNAGATWKTV